MAERIGAFVMVVIITAVTLAGTAVLAGLWVRLFLGVAGIR